MSAQFVLTRAGTPPTVLVSEIRVGQDKRLTFTIDGIQPDDLVARVIVSAKTAAGAAVFGRDVNTVPTAQGAVTDTGASGIAGGYLAFTDAETALYALGVVALDAWVVLATSGDQVPIGVASVAIVGNPVATSAAPATPIARPQFALAFADGAAPIVRFGRITQGQDWRLPFTLARVPADDLVASITVIARYVDGTTAFTRTITTALNAHGQIANTGAAGVAEGFVTITDAEAAGLILGNLAVSAWATLTASDPTAPIGTGTLTVVASLTTFDTTPATVTVSPAAPGILTSGTQQFTAVVRNAAGLVIPGAVVAWSSLSPLVATIDSVTGLATAGLAAGVATIRATSGAVHGDAVLTTTFDTTAATVDVAPPAPTVGHPGTQQFTAVVRNSGGSVIPGAAVVWSSLNVAIATVNAGTGLATTVGAGTVTIRATSGAVHGDASLTVDAGNPNLPPAAQSACVLWWDAVNGVVVGPAIQNGSTAGADINDATHVAGPPARKLFDADDFMTFFDALDAVFTNAAGWTILAAIGVSAADIAGVVRMVASKDDGATRELWLGMLSGKLRWSVWYAGANANTDQMDQNAATTAGRHVVGFGFNPALARAARVQPYLDGAAAAATYTGTGADGTISDTGQPLLLGLWNGWPSVDTQYGFGVYNRPLTAQEQLDNYTWLHDVRGWA